MIGPTFDPLARPMSKEIVGACQMARVTLATRQHARGDFAGRALKETILAAFRRSRIGLQCDQLTPDHPFERRLDGRGVQATHLNDRSDAKDLAQDGGGLEQRSVGGIASCRCMPMSMITRTQRIACALSMPR